MAFDKMKVCDKKAQVEGTLAHYWWECKLVLPPPKTVGRFLKKLNTELLYDPAMPLLDIHPENMKTFSRKDMYHNDYRSTVYNPQEMETIQALINKQLD